MIIDDYRGIRLPTSFCETIDNLLTRFEVPDDTKRLVFNFRDPTYYRTRVGLHPVEIQLSRDNDRAPWSLAFIASFLIKAIVPNPLMSSCTFTYVTIGVISPMLALLISHSLLF